MRFKPAKASVRQIVSQVKSKKLDLQPNFQRGEVWPQNKKQRLIDSILRRWYVPPIHVVQTVDGSQKEVLDGQQRLRAIVEFANDEFPVDGVVDPENKDLKRLHGRRYSELPPRYRRRFDSFRITVFTLVDYESAEPGELFFRLNQPATLTTAEQRNAFYGHSRDQVKKWVDLFAEGGIDTEVLGFSNKRMAYDDTLARVALSVEFKTLDTKVTADDLVGMYRSGQGYAAATDRRVRRAIKVLAEGRRYFAHHVHFNKATLYSWLVFIVRANEHLDGDESTGLPLMFGQYVSEFTLNLESLYSESQDQRSFWELPTNRALFQIFQDRATSRVADVSSVILRDLVIWFYLNKFFESKQSEEIAVLKRPLRPCLALAKRIYDDASVSSLGEEALEQVAMKRNWGAFV